VRLRRPPRAADRGRARAPARRRAGASASVPRPDHGGGRGARGRPPRRAHPVLLPGPRHAMRLPALLRENAGFRRFWCSQTASLAGDQVSLIALPLVGVLALHTGPGGMGLLTA